MVCGVHGAEVEVLSAVRQPAREQDIVKIHVEGTTFAFQVTSNHRLRVEGPSDSLVTVMAKDLLVRQRSSYTRIYDGSSLRDVLDVSMETMVTELVEIKFVADEPVLAWVLPKRASKNGRAALRPGAAVACLGSRLRVEDISADVEGLIVRRTFYDVPSECRHPHCHSADGRLQGHGS